MRRAARIEQSRRELERQQAALDQWLTRRRQLDAAGQYTTQLGSVEALMRENFRLMCEELDRATTGDPVREVYERCLRVDRQLVWVLRFWSYFRDKWDQRDDAELAPVLAAADEIVWSCYVTPFRQLDMTPAPAPLAYVAAEFSPYAVVRDRPPGSLRPSDALLRNALARLPVPVIGVPQVCVANPWWLVLLAHEVGHHVAEDLGDGALLKAVGALASASAARAAADGALPDDGWPSWAHELFADSFAGALVGAAHLWALAELEQGDDALMVRRVAGYPPPLVRQAIAAELLGRIGLAADQALPPLPAALQLDELAIDEDRRDSVRRLLAAAGEVAAALATQPLLGRAGLSELTGLRVEQVSRAGRADEWRRRLTAAHEVRPELELDAARLAAVGALAAWAELMAEADAGKRAAQADRLRERMLDIVPRCAEPGERAAGDEATPEIGDIARELAREAQALPLDEPVWSPELEALAGRGMV